MKLYEVEYWAAEDDPEDDEFEGTIEHVCEKHLEQRLQEIEENGDDCDYNVTRDPIERCLQCWKERKDEGYI
jgi:hypothetical protein